jgi:hypothetical protein
MAQRTLHEVFTCLIFDKSPTLGEVIKEIGWGSNREIRQKGFRIDFNFSLKQPFFSDRVKNLPKIKDPKTIISHTNAVLTVKGDSVLVIKVKNENRIT